MNGSVGSRPVSSRNSRRAVANKVSSLTGSPLGIDQAPSSLFLKNGPPGWQSSNCKLASRIRYINRPALTRDDDVNEILANLDGLVQTTQAAVSQISKSNLSTTAFPMRDIAVRHHSLSRTFSGPTHTTSTYRQAIDHVRKMTPWIRGYWSAAPILMRLT